jgi:hydrophobe/amphiphile efflux-3 (HAE3) family protein
MSRLINTVQKYPRTVISSCAFVTLLFLWQIPKLTLDPSLKQIIPQDHPVIVNIDLVDELFGGSEILILGVRSDNLFTQTTLEKFETFQDSLEDIDTFVRVFSLYTAKNIISSDDGFVVEDFLDPYPVTDSQITELQEKLRENDLVYGNIVARDFSGMAFICQLSSAIDFDEFELVEKLEALIDRFTGPEEIFISGLPYMRSGISTDMRKDMKTFMPYGIFLMIILLSFSFRSWLGVFLPFLVVVISIIWTFGFMSILGFTLPFIGVIIPVLLIAIANDYGIHIIAHYYEYTREGEHQTKSKIITRTMKSLSSPIFIAGLTTVVGFLSLMGHILPKVQEIGAFASFGIGIAFIMSILLIPAVLSLVRSPLILEKDNSLAKMNQFLHAWAAFFISFKKPFLFITAILLIIVSLGIGKIVVDTNPDHYYREESPIRINSAAITDMFGGASQMSVIIEGDIKDPEVLNKIEKLSNHLVKQPLVSQTNSIVDLIKKMHSAFHGGDPAFEVIPDDRFLIAQYLFLYSITGDESDFDQFLDDIDEPENAHLVVRLTNVRTAVINSIMDDARDYIRANFRDTPMKITGPAAMIGELAGMVVMGQIRSLMISIFIIFLVMAYVFRSWAGGFFAIIPLSTAILFVFGLMGYFEIELNMATAMLSSILIGVGIDYTVHFLWHLRGHIREGLELDDAIFLTMRISGKGIVFNAMSVIIGFSVLTVSAFLPVYFFGFLITLSISMCLFGALAMLPALIVLINPGFLYK